MKSDKGVLAVRGLRYLVYFFTLYFRETHLATCLDLREDIPCSSSLDRISVSICAT